METTTSPQSNYGTYYNTLQLSLPLDLGIKIDLEDAVVSFQEALEGVNLKKYLKRKERRGRNGHDKVMLLKVVLFGYMESQRDVRELAKRCRCDIRYMWLSNETTPSHMAFERLLKDQLIDSIDNIFIDINLNLIEKMGINLETCFQDGTKIEACANKYSFVYLKRITNARDKLFQKIREKIFELNFQYGYDFRIAGQYDAQEVGYVVQYLMEVMVHNDIEFVYGKGVRKSEIQRYYDTFLAYYVKLMEYEYWMGVIGEDRKSCSKTDHDAIMCATKMDYYCNTGLTRPCYNVQIGVSDGLIVNADLYQRAGDTRTFISFMERHKEFYGSYPKYPVADAAYGTYENYMFCLEKGMALSMKYNYYAKKNEAKFKKQPFNVLNWEKDGQNHKICPKGHVFDQYKSEKSEESGKYIKITQKWQSSESCEGCEHRATCYKSKNDRKIISRNQILEEFQMVVDETLGTEKGKEMKKQRSIQVEGAFGVIKEDMKFTRFTRRGIKNAKMEFLLVCIGYNLMKYHRYRLKKNKAVN